MPLDSRRLRTQLCRPCPRPFPSPPGKDKKVAHFLEKNLLQTSKMRLTEQHFVAKDLKAVSLGAKSGNESWSLLGRTKEEGKPGKRWNWDSSSLSFDPGSHIWTSYKKSPAWLARHLCSNWCMLAIYLHKANESWKLVYTTQKKWIQWIQASHASLQNHLGKILSHAIEHALHAEKEMVRSFPLIAAPHKTGAVLLSRHWSLKPLLSKQPGSDVSESLSDLQFQQSRNAQSSPVLTANSRVAAFLLNMHKQIGQSATERNTLRSIHFLIFILFYPVPLQTANHKTKASEETERRQISFPQRKCRREQAESLTDC